MPVVYNGKWLLGFIIALLLTSIFLIVYTGNTLFLLAPLVLSYCFLAIVNWKAAYWILLFCIPVSVQFNLNNTFALSLPDEPLTWLFLCILILIIAYRPTLLPAWAIQNPITLVIALQFVWLLVAVGNSEVVLLSLKFLAAKCWYLACFFFMPFLIFREKKDFKKGFILLFIPMLATIFIILFRQALLGFQFSEIGAAVGVLYLNHVEYAAVISIFFPFICIAYALVSGRRNKILVACAIALFVVAIFFSYARAALLAIAFAGLVAYAIKKRIVHFIMPAIYTAIILICAYLLQDKRYIDLRPDFEQTYMHSDYSSHLAATLKGRDISSMERLYRWVAAARMSTDRPFTGYGPHAFVYNYQQYALPIFKTYVSKNEEHSTTHNYFLYMLTEQGWPAMILYAMLILVVFAQAQRIYHRFSDSFYKNCTVGLAMAFAACFVNNFFSELIETHKVGALFYLILALLIVLDRKSRELPSELA